MKKSIFSGEYAYSPENMQKRHQYDFSGLSGESTYSPENPHVFHRIIYIFKLWSIFKNFVFWRSKHNMRKIQRLILNKFERIMRVLSGKAFQRVLKSRKIWLFLFLCSLEHISKRFHYFRSNRAVALSLFSNGLCYLEPNRNKPQRIRCESAL